MARRSLWRSRQGGLSPQALGGAWRAQSGRREPWVHTWPSPPGEHREGALKMILGSPDRREYRCGYF